jgi:DNA mismatch endonuclease, patch repair protein
LPNLVAKFTARVSHLDDHFHAARRHTAYLCRHTPSMLSACDFELAHQSAAHPAEGSEASTHPSPMGATGGLQQQQPRGSLMFLRALLCRENTRGMDRRPAQVPVTSRPRSAGSPRVASWASSPAVRRNMQANRGRDTGPELKLRHLLHNAGLRYRIHWPVPSDRRRRIDIAFTRRKVAVFVDGCFWHRCPAHYVAPKANADFWDAKIRGTTERDIETTTLLEGDGWLVLRFWEHEQSSEVAECIRKVLQKRIVGSSKNG